MSDRNLKRRDKKGRILLTGEIQKSNGMYRYKYTDAYGRERYAYSWRLTASDIVPSGKKGCIIPLRVQEEKIRNDIRDHINADGSKITVIELVDKYYALNFAERQNTKDAHRFLANCIRNDEIAKLKITMIRRSDAISFVKRIRAKGYAYSTVLKLKRTLKASFELAIADDYLRKNPFDFDINSRIISNNTKEVEALTPEQVETLLNFMQNDKTYRKYYDATVILLETGLRISELCGLTIKDVDMENRIIRVDHQLLKGPNGLIVEKTKTKCGIRNIPITPKCYESMKKVLAKYRSRKFKNRHVKVDGYRGFVFLNDSGNPLDRKYFSNVYMRVVDKYNRRCEEGKELPRISPHMLRHTFCTNCAMSGMNPKILQYLMGHEDVSITLNVYTSISGNDVNVEMKKIFG